MLVGKVIKVACVLMFMVYNAFGYSSSHGATLIGPAGSLTLMERYNLNVSIDNVSSGDSISSVEYFIDGRAIPSPHNGTSFNEPARKPGVRQIFARVTLSNGIALTTDTLAVNVQFPRVDDILTDSTIVAGMNDAWSVSLTFSSSSSVREFGFWIFADTRSGSSISYEYGELQNGITIDECADFNSVASINLTGAQDMQSSLVLGGGRYTVASFHTHPPYLCSEGIGRLVGPSRGDLTPHPQGIPGIVYDFPGPRLDFGHEVSANPVATTLGNRRTVFPVFQ